MEKYKYIDNSKIPMKKIFLFLIVGIFLFSLISANTLTTLGVFKQGQDVRITQVCSDSTYINISSISYPNSTIAESNIEMVSGGNGEFYYLFDKTNTLGRYDVRGISDGCEGTFATYFDITRTGGLNTNFQGIISIAFLLSIVALTFLFMILGIKFSDYKGLGAVAIFFYGIGMLFVLYTMFLGYKFAYEMALIQGAEIQITMFQVIGLLFGSLVLGLVIYVFIQVIKGWQFKKEQLQQNDGWDNGLFK